MPKILIASLLSTVLFFGALLVFKNISLGLHEFELKNAREAHAWSLITNVATLIKQLPDKQNLTTESVQNIFPGLLLIDRDGVVVSGRTPRILGPHLTSPKVAKIAMQTDNAFMISMDDAGNILHQWVFAYVAENRYVVLEVDRKPPSNHLVRMQWTATGLFTLIFFAAQVCILSVAFRVRQKYAAGKTSHN